MTQNDPTRKSARAPSRHGNHVARPVNTTNEARNPQDSRNFAKDTVDAWLESARNGAGLRNGTGAIMQSWKNIATNKYNVPGYDSSMSTTFSQLKKEYTLVFEAEGREDLRLVDAQATCAVSGDVYETFKFEAQGAGTWEMLKTADRKIYDLIAPHVETRGGPLVERNFPLVTEMRRVLELIQSKKNIKKRVREDEEAEPNQDDGNREPPNAQDLGIAAAAPDEDGFVVVQPVDNAAAIAAIAQQEREERMAREYRGRMPDNYLSIATKAITKLDDLNSVTKQIAEQNKKLLKIEEDRLEAEKERLTHTKDIRNDIAEHTKTASESAKQLREIRDLVEHIDRISISVEEKQVVMNALGRETCLTVLGLNIVSSHMRDADLEMRYHYYVVNSTDAVRIGWLQNTARSLYDGPGEDVCRY